VPAIPFKKWPKILQRPEVKGVFVGGCCCPWEEKPDPKETLAHAHLQKDGGIFRGWICFSSEKIPNKYVVIHELSHLISETGHSKRWRETVLKLGGKITACGGMQSYVPKKVDKLKKKA